MSAASTPPIVPDPQAAPARRPLDALGIASVSVASVVLLPSLLLFLVGLIPSMNAIWWLGIMLIPPLGIAGLLAVILGIVGVLIAVRRSGRSLLSVIGIVLGVVAIVPIAWLFLSSLG